MINTRLLEKFCVFLEKSGYIDSDWWAEKPTAIESFSEDEENKTQYPHREICGLCNRVSPVGFWVPNDVWESVVHTSRMQDIHCLSCFIERADEKLIDWSDEIKFYPVSLRSHINNCKILLSE